LLRQITHLHVIDLKNFEHKTESREKNTSSLAQTMDKLLHVYELEEGYTRTKVLQSWNSVLGPVVAKRTRQISFQDKKLFVRISSAPLKKELSMSKSKVIGMLNAEIGKPAIEELIFL
jgi:predicted nucleic acid-binding Zn ribbon protein